MEIFEMAMKIEQEGEKQYRDIAAQCSDKGLRNIFNTLADNEVAHYNTFKQMAEGGDSSLPDTGLTKVMGTLFKEMKENALAFSDKTPLEMAYKQALEGERKAVIFYNEMLDKATSDAQREVIQQIIDEEENHVTLMRNMIDYLEAPATWIEHAETNHLESF